MCPCLFVFVCVSNDKPCAHTSGPIFTIYASNDVIPLLVVPFGGRNFKYLKFTGVLTQKGAWLGIFSANKSIEYLDAIFGCIDR